MADFDQTLPAALAEANALDYDYNDGEGVDFEPYTEFQSADDNASWIRAWTGNADLDGAEYRIFGQDGTGGYAAISRLAGRHIPRHGARPCMAVSRML